ncbi:MAG: hypothetical protein JWO80_3064 [Bryobacterales bacterium]|nr:hypothetical protein [Bryobacterales bacterium]
MTIDRTDSRLQAAALSESEFVGTAVVRAWKPSCRSVSEGVRRKL